MNSRKKWFQRTKTKLLSSYYGHPEKDLKLICITGSTGKSVVAHFVYEILKVAGMKVAIFASDKPFKVSLLHKFLKDATREKIEYVVVTAPAESLEADVFYGLPVCVAALTDFIPSTLKDLTANEYLAAKSTLFKMNPEIVILNYDDAYYFDFAKFKGAKDTLTYGTGHSVSLRIDNSTLYKKGTEANLIVGTKSFTTASFLTGEMVVSYMACASVIAIALKISPAAIMDGIGNFEG